MVLHFHGHIFTILFCLFPLSTLSFLPFCSCSVISKLALPPHKTSKGRKECPLAPFDQKHNRNGCFKFRPIKIQQKHCHISTWKDKPIHTLARCGISNHCCCTKKISDKILIWLWNTHTVKQHWYWKSHSGKQKHTLLHRNKVEACFFSLKRGWFLFIFGLSDNFWLGCFAGNVVCMLRNDVNSCWEMDGCVGVYFLREMCQKSVLKKPV